MPIIRPLSDLRDNYDDISRIVHESSEPVFFTKDGYVDPVAMSMDAYEQLRYDKEIYTKLKEAELKARYTCKRFIHQKVFSDIRHRLRKRWTAWQTNLA